MVDEFMGMYMAICFWNRNVSYNAYVNKDPSAKILVNNPSDLPDPSSLKFPVSIEYSFTSRLF